MPRKRPGRPITIARYLLVERWRASVGSHYGGSANFDPHSAHLHFHGQLDEPLKGVRDAQLQIGPDPEWETRTHAGMLIGIKPLVQFVIAVPPVQFERLWQLAPACRSIHLAFTEPYRSSATIKAWYASTNLPDEDE
jgi:hypothetical protein